MSESITAILGEHLEVRAAWLESMAVALAEDRGLQAALLYGSLGRGDADVWSDVDAIIVIDDSVLRSVVADRLGFARRFGQPLYVLDSPWNAPLGGAQINVLYRLNSPLPLYVDWNFWPLSMAARPSDTSVIFQRSPDIPRAVPSRFEEWATFERQPTPWLDDSARQHAQFGMVPIAVKFCVRRQRHRLVQLLEGIGAESVPESPHGEISVISERLEILGVGQDPEAVGAARTMCQLAERFLASDHE